MAGRYRALLGEKTYYLIVSRARRRAGYAVLACFTGSWGGNSSSRT